MSDNPRIEDLRRRVQKDPASIAFAQLAEEYRRVGQCEESVQVCRAGLAIHPTYLSARVTLGRALIELGQLESAQHELQMVLVSAPDNLAAIRGLGEILHRRGALPEALVYYQRALGLARNDPDLEQTVSELTRAVARAAVAPSAVPVAAAPAAELLTLEQLTQELEANSAAATAQPAPAAPPVLVAPAVNDTSAISTPEPNADSRTIVDANGPARASALRTLARLEQWLTAIDGFRTERRA